MSEELNKYCAVDLYDRTTHAIVDLDDVLADFPMTFIAYIKAKTGKCLDIPSGEYGLENYVKNKYGAYGEELVNNFYEEGYLKYLDIIHGAGKTFSILKNSGFTLHALTGRPYWINECVNDTLYWLAKNGFQFDTLNFCKNKGEFCKATFDQSASYWIAIEDSLEYALQLSKVVNKVYLRNMHHNINHETPPNVVRFCDFREIHESLISDSMTGKIKYGSC